MSTTDRKRPPLAVVILAAGLGTRMKSDLPKVLHGVCGRPMLSYVIDAALSVSPERVVVVTGPDQDAINDILPVGCERAVQRERRGDVTVAPARGLVLAEVTYADDLAEQAQRSRRMRTLPTRYDQ